MKSIVSSVKTASRLLLPHRLYNRLDDYYFYTLRPAYFALPDHWFHLRMGTFHRRLVIVVGTGHRVGSTWFANMVSELAHCQFGQEQLPTALRETGGTLRLTPASYAFLEQQRGHKIYKSHSPPPTTEREAACARFLSIYRDPRDVLTSLSFYLAWLPEARGGRPETFRHLSPQERIRSLLDYPAYLCELAFWFHTPFAYKIRYEALWKDPCSTLAEVACYLNIVTTPAAIRQIMENHSFRQKSGRGQGEAKDDGPMRKGIVGDWQNYFDAACIIAFKQAQGGAWNRLLVEMGYEESLQWE